MIAIICLILQVVLMGLNNQTSAVEIIPAVIDEAEEWEQYNREAFEEYCSEFDAIFNAIEYKRAKNGRSMVKGINDKSFKFAKKG